MSWDNFHPEYYSWYDSMMDGNWTPLPLVILAVAGIVAALSAFFSSEMMKNVSKMMTGIAVLAVVLGLLAWLATGASMVLGQVAAVFSVLFGATMLVFGVFLLGFILTKPKTKFRRAFLPLALLYASSEQYLLDAKHERRKPRKARSDEPGPRFPRNKLIIHVLSLRFSPKKWFERFAVGAILIFMGWSLIGTVTSGRMDQGKISSDAHSNAIAFFSGASHFLPPVDIERSVPPLREWAMCRYALELTEQEARNLLAGLLPAGLQFGPLFADQGGEIFVPARKDFQNEGLGTDIVVRGLRLVHTGGQAYVLVEKDLALPPIDRKGDCSEWQTRNGTE